MKTVSRGISGWLLGVGGQQCGRDGRKLEQMNLLGDFDRRRKRTTSRKSPAEAGLEFAQVLAEGLKRGGMS
jgi:hypothetical protein